MPKSARTIPARARSAVLALWRRDPTGRGRRGRAWWLPPLRWLLVAAAASLLLGWLTWQSCGLRGCPAVERLSALQPGGAPVLLDRNGDQLARLTPSPQTLVRLDSLPAYVPAAFVAIEDRRFYHHGGVDWRRMAGSLLANVRAGGVAQGGSTITMQLARNVFPDRLPGQQRTLDRKLLEMRVAGAIEDRFSKNEVLELYLNHIYFGGSVYGIQAASRAYFGRPATHLSLAQAATLAAMPKAPNAYDPREHPDRARQRRDLVLSLMAAQGRVSADSAERAQSTRLHVVPERPLPEAKPPPAPYFVRAVRRMLEHELGDGLYAAPLRVHTTLDPVVQHAAERAIDRQLSAIEAGVYGRYRGDRRHGDEDAVDSAGTRYVQGAAVVMRADSGDVLALVGGRDYADSPYDRATQARRQVGSAFKPFVFAAALESGYAPSQELSDEPLVVKLPGGEVWEPENFSGRSGGEVTLREAAVHSVNIATARLALAVGLDNVVRAARDAGIDERMVVLPSLALGAIGIPLLQLTAAYTPFAEGGRGVAPRLVTTVEDTAGKVVWRSNVHRHRAFSAGVAYLVTSLLRDVVDRGTGHEVRDVGLRVPAAGKTGTTNEGFDAWFVGYTPDLAGGVWIGMDRPQPIAAGATGGELAAPVWGRIMRAAYRDRKAPDAWERPESVVERKIDPASGLVLAHGCRPAQGRARSELFLESELPATICPAGETEEGVLARAWDGVRGAFAAAGRWVAGLFGGGGEKARTEQERERYLGRPRLPREGEPAAAPISPRDTAEAPLGVPVDSFGFPDSLPAPRPVIPAGSVPGADSLLRPDSVLLPDTVSR